MSDKDFNKKIRQKLYEHQSDYDPKAWEKMKGILPVPWYATFFQTYGGWLWGALASTALVFTFFYQNTKNNELYDEISTLKNQLATSQSDTVFIEKTNMDTLYVSKFVDRVVEVPVLVYKSDQFIQETGQVITEVASNVRSQDERGSDFVPQVNDRNNLEVTKKKLGAQAGIKTSASEKLNEIKESEVFSEASNTDLATDGQEDNLVSSSSEKTKGEIEEAQKENWLEKESRDENNIGKPEIKKESIAEVTEEEPEKLAAVQKSILTKKAKKFKLPKMRIGVTSDYMGLNVLASGLNVEFFLLDKLSLNTSILFSGLVESKHPLADDFNKSTGKDFRREFAQFNPRIPERINDITIQTSFVRLPIHLNYYISTWSRLKFLVSAGTKLDLSVYQNIDFNSGSNTSPIRNRFEARPSPKVLNNLNYGMGLEYQYGGFVGQLVPYFDFSFRETDYFKPKRNFGLLGSLKYEFGN